MSARTKLTYNLRRALQGINRDDGYETWIGRKTLVGQNRTNDTEPPCAVLTPGSEVRTEQSNPNGSVTIEYTVSAYSNRLETPIPGAPGDPHDEYAIVDAMLADIRQAIEGDGAGPCPIEGARNLQYEGAEPIYHESGGEYCGVAARYAISTLHPD